MPTVNSSPLQNASSFQGQSWLQLNQHQRMIQSLLDTVLPLSQNHTLVIEGVQYKIHHCHNLLPVQALQCSKFLYIHVLLTFILSWKKCFGVQMLLLSFRIGSRCFKGEPHYHSRKLVDFIYSFPLQKQLLPTKERPTFMMLSQFHHKLKPFCINLNLKHSN